MKKIKILGPGCPKCETLFKFADEAARDMGVEFEIEKVKDIQEIMKYGVMMTPGLVIDEKVVSVGKVLTADKIKKFLI